MVLIGFMGSGKSTLSMRLSLTLGIPLISTDKMIEEMMQRSIPEIFDGFGEEVFRLKESEVFTKLCSLQIPHIIDCGGGFGAYQDVKKLGEVVFLNFRLEEILARLDQDEYSKRPLLHQSDLKELFHKRSKLYMQKADCVLENDCEIDRFVWERALNAPLLP
ncbi:shikimate kinase [Helicobacter pametensis]|uniref:shikimate kinase n=2 Tax=Helicobacter pametensis TaxID=95149 RepID=UPI0004B9A310|nr:shikimate kinase [Helicobacter pametensis]